MNPLSTPTHTFTLAHGCTLIAALLPIVCAGIAKAGFKRFDNNNPRDWLAAQDGFRRRANAAQGNSWEAFSIFAAAVLTAIQTGAPQDRVDALAVVFILARVAFIACYVADRASVRTLTWTVGLVASLALFVSSRW
jgi:uncharacterized MAPEG superfamily protein